MKKRKLYCWWGKHEVTASDFAPNYLKPTYNSAGRICKKCAREKADAQKAKREKSKNDMEFYYGFRF